MRLYNVRRGQFVYHNNKLHRVYSVKPFFKKSVHLIRLDDFTQVLTTAKEIDYYRPKHLDSFIFNHQRYTLHKDERAEVGDYILVINPRPDSLDHHHLHAIEMVASIEENGVISHKSNGIKHNEYWVMAAGHLDGATIIDLQVPDPNQPSVEEDPQTDDVVPEKYVPQIGDVYQKVENEPALEAMVIAVEGETFYLGGDFAATKEDLNNTEKWIFLFNVLGQR